MRPELRRQEGWGAGREMNVGDGPEPEAELPICTGDFIGFH